MAACLANVNPSEIRGSQGEARFRGIERDD